MGNRAFVVFTNQDEDVIGPAVYVHWNGGPESIYAFLTELDRRKIRNGGDMPYQVARFVHIIGDFFDGTEAGACSLGIAPIPPEGDLEPQAR